MDMLRPGALRLFGHLDTFTNSSFPVEAAKCNGVVAFLAPRSRFSFAGGERFPLNGKRDEWGGGWKSGGRGRGEGGPRVPPACA